MGNVGEDQEITRPGARHIPNPFPLVGVFLAFLVALGNHYYWQMMLPGAILGAIVGYATYRHPERVARAA